MSKGPARALLDAAVGWRHGVVADAGRVPATMADLPLSNWSAVLTPGESGSSAGGVAADDEAARAAAIAEAVERYAAAVCPLPEVDATGASPVTCALALADFSLHAPSQRLQPGFPWAAAYAEPGPLTAVGRAVDGQAALAPIALVTLDPRRTSLATSSGLAADPSPLRATLRAVQELVERDALMVTWLHSLGARRVPLPAELRGPVEERGGDVTCLDLTPAYSPHPVAAVAGNLPERGRPRLSLGVACRARWDDAAAKAWAEWAQGTVFAGLFRAGDPGRALAPADVVDFDLHAAHYTLHPDRWEALPLWRGPAADRPADAAVVGAPAAELRHLVTSLAGAGVDLYVRDLTTVDAAACGLRVVRALSPQLVPIHGDHRWPHLGGTCADVTRRYPWATPGPFPNPSPHPLG